MLLLLLSSVPAEENASVIVVECQRSDSSTSVYILPKRGRERQRDRQRETERGRERQRETERDRERLRETERDRKR